MVSTQQIGVNFCQLSNTITGFKVDPVICRRIDLFFGQAILTPPHEFSHNNMVRDAIGIDPVISSVRELRKRARAMGVANAAGVRNSKKLDRAGLITGMVAEAAIKNIAAK